MLPLKSFSQVRLRFASRPCPALDHRTMSAAGHAESKRWVTDLWMFLRYFLFGVLGQLLHLRHDLRLVIRIHQVDKHTRSRKHHRLIPNLMVRYRVVMAGSPLQSTREDNYETKIPWLSRQEPGVSPGLPRAPLWSLRRESGRRVPPPPTSLNRHPFPRLTGICKISRHSQSNESERGERFTVTWVDLLSACPWESQVWLITQRLVAGVYTRRWGDLTHSLKSADVTVRY